MKTTSRKRLLISSVAMLLVAMLALGTATFAWFTTDTTTQATGISVQTSKKSLLLVSSRTSPWTDNLNYNFGTDEAPNLLQPASSYDGENWYKAQAATNPDFVKAQLEALPKIAALTQQQTSQVNLAANHQQHQGNQQVTAETLAVGNLMGVDWSENKL